MATPDELALALQYGPQAGQAFQRSQYLSQALQAIQASTSNMRSPSEAGLKLLADALLQRSRKSADQNVLDTLYRAQQGAVQPGLDWLDKQSQPPAMNGAPPPMAPQPSPQVAPQPQGPTPPAPMQSAPPPQALSAPVQPQSPWSPNVVRTIAGEAEGEGPQGMRQVAGVILKRAQESGLSPDQVVTAPHQFEGLHSPRVAGLAPGTPRYDGIVNSLQGVQPGQFDSFYSPGAQAALGRKPPAWDNGTGQDIGHNRFFQTGYSAPPGMQPQGTATQDTFGNQVPPPPPPPSAGPPGAGVGPGAPQVPSGGAPAPSMQGAGPTQAEAALVPPPPPPPSAGPPGAGVGPGAPQVPSGGAPAPSMQGAGPTQAEAALIHQLLANPRTYAQGAALLLKVQQRAASPDEWEAKTDPATGQAYWASKTRPGVSMANDISGARVNPTTSYQNGSIVSYDPRDPTHPQSTPIPGQQFSSPQAIPGLEGKYVIGPNGKPELIGSDPLNAQRISEIRGKFFDSDAYKKYSEAAASLQGFRLASGWNANNGVLDTAAVDSYLRSINPGMGARNTTVQMFLNHLGTPQEIQGKILALTGNGYLTPESLRQMDSVMQSYTQAHYNQVQQLHAADVAFGRNFGLDENALGENLGPAPDQLPKAQIRGPQPFGGQPQPQQQLPRLSPQDAAHLPRGTHFIGMDGVERVHQ